MMKQIAGENDVEAVVVEREIQHISTTKEFTDRATLDHVSRELDSDHLSGTLGPPIGEHPIASAHIENTRVRADFEVSA
jgi:hypothetical protein